MNPALGFGLALLLSIAAGARADVARPDPAAAARLVVGLTNGLRAANGVGPTEPDAKLAAAARALAEFMAATDRYGHEADGSTHTKRALAHGYDYCSVEENIATLLDTRGFSSDALGRGLFAGWENSPGHRRNMLAPEVVDTAVAIAQSPKSQRYYAVQMFGRPRAKMIRFEVYNATPRDVRYEVDGKAYVNAPTVTRSHALCIEATLTTGSGRDEIALRPASGRHYSFVPEAGGRVRLRQD